MASPIEATVNGVSGDEVFAAKELQSESDDVIGPQISIPKATSLPVIRPMPNHALTAKMNTNKFTTPMIPINDLHGVEFSGVPKMEKIARCKLASFCRLADILGWMEGISNTVTLRLSSDTEHFLTNPYGLLCHEITASNLIKADMQGSILESGSTDLGIHQVGYLLHTAIHSARPDVKCIMTLRTASAVSVSVMKCGLLPLSQDSLVIGNVSYHSYNPACSLDELIDTITRDLGPNNKVLFLRNFGLVACGDTIEEAFHYARHAAAACDVQVQVAHLGASNLTVASDEAKQQTYDAARGKVFTQDKGHHFQPGELQFSAYMRQMDNAGFRTGYLYSQSLVELQHTTHRRKGSAEIPPAATGLFLEEEYLARYGSPIKNAQNYKRHEWAAKPASVQQTEGLVNHQEAGAGDVAVNATTHSRTEAAHANASTPKKTVVKQQSEKSDTLRSTDSATDEETTAAGGEKKKFRMPSFGKKKKTDKDKMTAV